MKRACSHGRKAVLLAAVATLAATTLAIPATALGKAPQATTQLATVTCPVPAGANNATVRWGYEALLFRCPDAGGLAYWAAALSKPNGQAVFGSALANSGESLNIWVDLAYLDALQRDADPGGLTYWTNRLHNGLRWDQLEATLFATDRSNNQQFVENLYESIFGRTADVGGLSYWTNRLNAGASRYSVAFAMETSTGRTLTWAAVLVFLELGRVPTVNEAIFLGADVKLLGDPYKVAGGIAAMPEFSQYAQSLPELPSVSAAAAHAPTAAGKATVTTQATLHSAAADIARLVSSRRFTR